MDKYAHKLSSLNAALKLDKVIEYKFKEYCHTKNADDLSIVVCGTGFTGIEFAAELGSRLDELCLIGGIPRDVPKITCIGRSDRILPMFSKKASALAQKKLEAFGVEVICGGEVQECLEDGVMIKHNGELKHIKGNTILWSAGERVMIVLNVLAWKIKKDVFKLMHICDVRNMKIFMLLVIVRLLLHAMLFTLLPHSLQRKWEIM